MFTIVYFEGVCVTRVILAPGACGRGVRAAADDTQSGGSAGAGGAGGAGGAAGVFQSGVSFEAVFTFTWGLCSKVVFRSKRSSLSHGKVVFRSKRSSISRKSQNPDE